MTILDCFPYPTLRPGQYAVLKWLEANWNRYDVFVLQAPVAAGKSGLAVTIGRWANSMGMHCGITTPDNVLVKQYRKDFNLPYLPIRRSFASGDLFDVAKADFKAKPLRVQNNYTLLANRAYADVQIFDEAHELIPMLQDFEGIKIWKHLTPYPGHIRTAAELLMWAASRGPKDKLGKKIGKLLNKNPMDYTIVHEEAPYRGHIRDCLRIYPLTPKNNAPILWPPSKVRKLVLMSATIAPPDIEDLGLHRRRVGYIEVPSDIPVERRKFVYAGVGSMGQAGQQDNVAKAVDKIIGIRSAHQLRRGFVHSTYGLARKVPDMPWLLKHDSANKQQVLSRWLESAEDNRVFLGCGLTTGLDLKGGLASWQAIMKCQFPDLGDPAVMAKATNNPDWYAWVTVRQIVQAYGRVCRAPNDEGVTYMLDSDFLHLYNNYRHLFPGWFLEAIEWGL